MSFHASDFRQMLGWGVFLLVRALDSLMPPPLLRAALWPLALGRAICEARRPPPPRVSSFGALRARMVFHLSRALLFFPDRMAAPRWRGRCRLRGLDPVLAALNAGRPVVLATLHFGPLHLMRYWLRAMSVPAVTLIEVPAEGRNALRRRKDELSDRTARLQAVPHVVLRTNLREAVRLLERPVALMVAMDFEAGKAVEVDDGDVGAARLSTGAVRLAARGGALLVPCLIRETGAWQYEIRCGPPVPDDLLATGDVVEASNWLWRNFSPEVRQHPEDCGVEILECLRPQAVNQINGRTEPAAR